MDPNEKKSRAGSATTHPMRQAPKGGRSNKKTVGSQVGTAALRSTYFTEKNVETHHFLINHCASLKHTTCASLKFQPEKLERFTYKS